MAKQTGPVHENTHSPWLTPVDTQPFFRSDLKDKIREGEMKKKMEKKSGVFFLFFLYVISLEVFYVNVQSRSRQVEERRVVLFILHSDTKTIDCFLSVFFLCVPFFKPCFNC